MMNRQVASKSTASFDWLKWAGIAGLIVAGIWANFRYSEVDWSLRFAGWIVLACLLLFLAWHTRVGRKVWLFSVQARGELRKVVWPTRPETTQTTLIVAAMVIVMAVILWGLDTLLLWVVSLLSGQ